MYHVTRSQNTIPSLLSLKRSWMLQSGRIEYIFFFFTFTQTLSPIKWLIRFLLPITTTKIVNLFFSSISLNYYVPLAILFSTDAPAVQELGTSEWIRTKKNGLRAKKKRFSAVASNFEIPFYWVTDPRLGLRTREIVFATRRNGIPVTQFIFHRLYGARERERERECARAISFSRWSSRVTFHSRKVARKRIHKEGTRRRVKKGMKRMIALEIYF